MKNFLVAILLACGLAAVPWTTAEINAQEPPAAAADAGGDLEAEVPPEAGEDEAKDEAGDGEEKAAAPIEARDRAKDIKNVEEAGQTAKAAYDAFKNKNILHGIALLIFLLVWIARMTPLKERFQDKKWWLGANFVLSVLAVVGYAVLSAPTAAEVDWFAVLEGLGQVITQAGGIWGVLKVFGLDKTVKTAEQKAAAA